MTVMKLRMYYDVHELNGFLKLKGIVFENNSIIPYLEPRCNGALTTLPESADCYTPVEAGWPPDLFEVLEKYELFGVMIHVWW